MFTAAVALPLMGCTSPRGMKEDGLRMIPNLIQCSHLNPREQSMETTTGRSGDEG